MHQAILRSCEDKAKVEFIEVAGVANILQEKVSDSITDGQGLYIHTVYVEMKDNVSCFTQWSTVSLILRIFLHFPVNLI